MIVKPWNPFIYGKRSMIKPHVWRNATERSFWNVPTGVYVVSQVGAEGPARKNGLRIPGLRPVSPSSPARRQASGTMLESPESPVARKDTEITLMQSSIWVTVTKNMIFVVKNPMGKMDG